MPASFWKNRASSIDGVLVCDLFAAYKASRATDQQPPG
jgi:hypothetical protein